MKKVDEHNSSRSRKMHGKICSSCVCMVTVLCITQLLIGCIPLVYPTGRGSMHGTRMSFKNGESKENIPEILVISFCRDRNGVIIECNDFGMKSFLKYPKVVSSETVMKNSLGIGAMLIVGGAAFSATSQPEELALCVIAPGYKMRCFTPYRIMEEDEENLTVNLEPLHGRSAVAELISMRDILNGEMVNETQIMDWRTRGLEVFPSDPTAAIKFNSKGKEIVESFFDRSFETMRSQGYPIPTIG